MNYKTLQTTAILFVCLLSFSNCKKEEKFHITNVSKESSKQVTSDILIAGGNSSNYYDIQITGSHLALLDYKSDSVLRVLNINDLTPKQVFYRGGNKQEANSPAFIKQIVRENAPDNILLYEEISGECKEITFSKENIEMELSPFTIPPLRGDKNAEINLVDDRYYYITTEPQFVLSYIYRKTNSDVIVGEPHAYINPKLPNQPIAYLSHLSVNEDKNIIYSASRFSNVIQIFDTTGRVNEMYLFGEKPLSPKVDSKKRRLDIEHSTKYFIQIYSTAKYAYCLYSGSSKVDQPSRVIILDWKGNYIKTLQADKPLTAIAIDSSNKYLLGITRNSEGGTDIVKYKI